LFTLVYHNKYYVANKRVFYFICTKDMFDLNKVYDCMFDFNKVYDCMFDFNKVNDCMFDFHKGYDCMSDLHKRYDCSLCVCVCII